MLQGVDGHGQGQELAAIVPNGCCTKEIGIVKRNQPKTLKNKKPQPCKNRKDAAPGGGFYHATRAA
jgi:hypothetical protein